MAEINGTDYEFFLNITDLVLKEEHERRPTKAGKIVTKSVLETVSFKKFTMQIVLTEKDKFIHSPNRSILRQLADSWLVTIINAINKRFVRPRILEQSQSHFRNYKNTFLHNVCASLWTSFDDSSTSVGPFEDKNVLPEDSQSYEKYTFTDIRFSSFSKFANCSSKSSSVPVESSCPTDNYYSHTLLFTFTYSARKFVLPSFNWTFNKVKGQRYENDGYTTSSYRRHRTTTTELFQSGSMSASAAPENYLTVVKYLSARLTVNTDIDGRKTDDEMKVGIDIAMDKERSSAKLNYFTSRFLELLGNWMARTLKLNIATNF